MKKIKKFLSVLLVVCILSGMNIIHPGANTATAETLTSKEEINVSDSVETSDDLNMSGKQEDLPQQTENLITDLKENSSVMDYIDESEFVSSQPIKRLKDKEKLNTYVFLNQDGTESVYYMEKNVKYKDATGKILEKDITLTKKDKAYKVTENDVKLSLPEVITDGVELGYNENNVKLVPKNSKSNVKAVFDEKNNSVTYNNFYGKGIDIRYTPLLNGVKEDIILESYTGVSSFDFTLYTNGLKVFSNDGSFYIAEKQDAEDKIYLGEIVIYDAVGRPDKGNLTVKTIRDGQKYTLTISANEEFLTDSLTVYPVTIDPTLEISQNIQGIDAIVDATVFSGFPTENFGKYAYCTLGQINSGYGIARTIVRFDGLINDAVYNSISSSDITSAKFYVKEAAGVAAHNVSVLYNQSSMAWTETNITWNTLSTQLSAPIASSNLNNNDWTYFELTDYVKRCRAGELTLSSGLVLKLTSNETLSYTQFDSSEHETAGFRPYLVVTYSGDTSISLNTTSVDVDEGEKYTLIATTNPADASVIWTTSDRTIATVSVLGRISGIKAGVATITATIKGTDIKQECTVYVTVPDGVYTISNMDYGKVLDVKNNGIANNTSVLLCPQNSHFGGLNQKWRIKHLGQGYYSVRPLHKLDMCLYKNGSNVTIYKSNLNETIQNTPLIKRWTITYERIQDTTSKGYVFKNSLLALTIGEQVTTSDYDVVVAERDLADVAQYWSLSPDDSATIRGTRIYDSSNPGAFYDSTYTQEDMFFRNIVVGNANSLSSLHLVPVFYSNVISDSVMQTFQWSSSDSGIASVDLQSGAVTGYRKGVVTITGSKSVNGTVYYIRFKIYVFSNDESASIFLSSSSIDIDESCSKKITVGTNPSTSDVVWSSSDTNVASVDSNGLITGHKAGVANITATIRGTDMSATCVVYVTISDGIYVISNMDNGKVLDVENNGVANNTNVLVCSQNSYCGGLNQKWRIEHLGQGYYSVRPLHKLDMCLYSNGATCRIYESDIHDTLETTPKSKRWTIAYEVVEGASEKGYVFKCCGETMVCERMSGGADIDYIAGVDVANLSNKKPYWTLTLDDSAPVEGVRVYDVQNPGVFYDSNYYYEDTPRKETLIDTRYTLFEIGFVAAYYSTYVDELANNDFVYHSSAPSVVDFDQSGYVNTYNVGTSLITVRHSVNQEPCLRFIIVVNAFPDGLYYIQNYGSRHYLQLDESLSDNLESGIIEQHEFNGYESQQWMITSLKNGYHKIISEESGLALSVKIGENYTNNVDLIQEPFSESLRQQWQISKTDSGSLIIKARSSEGSGTDLVMALGWGLNGYDGLNVQQRTYGIAGDYTDEWCVREVVYAYSVGGEIEDGDPVIDAAKNWRICGYTSDYDITPTLYDLCEDFLDSEIVFFSSHGTQHALDLPGELQLSDGSHVRDPNTECIDGYNLSNAKLFVYVACSTASYEDGKDYNLCTRTIDAGVDCVVGWPVKILIADGVKWFERFQKKLMDGESVVNAKKYANSFNYYENCSIKTCKILGNENLIINKDLSINAVSLFNRTENVLYTDIVCESFEISDISEILNNRFDSFYSGDAELTVTYTDYENNSCVIDYNYVINGFITNSNYSIIVENGKIVLIRDNTGGFNGVIELLPEVTPMQVNNALELATSELYQIDASYQVVEQEWERYFDIETEKCYIKVKTMYETNIGAYGGIVTLFDLCGDY